jgi:hypothetical protein
MIEKFNFYDLYAYFLPGVILLALIAIPFALATGFSLPWQLGVLAIIISYVVGQLVQAIARELAPSKIQGRYPSQILLDGDDKKLSTELKEALGRVIKAQFGLNVVMDTNDQKADGQKIDGNRDDAFRLCRTYLLQEAKKTYAEQLQGMYALLRGAATACLIALPAYVCTVICAIAGQGSGGILVSALASGTTRILASAVLWLCIFFAIQSLFRYLANPRVPKHTSWKDRATRFARLWYLWLFSAFALVLGNFFPVAVLSSRYHLSCDAVIFAAVGAVIFLCSTILVFELSSYSQMWDFSKTVYREYAALRQQAQGTK